MKYRKENSRNVYEQRQSNNVRTDTVSVSALFASNVMWRASERAHRTGDGKKDARRTTN